MTVIVYLRLLVSIPYSLVYPVIASMCGKQFIGTSSAVLWNHYPDNVKMTKIKCVLRKF